MSRQDETERPGPPRPSDRTSWMHRYEPWLKVIARMEIDSRFAGKFSASDAVQQTLAEAWRCWDDFRGEGEGQRLAWLRRILAHQLAHLARHYAGTAKRDVHRERSLEQSLARSSMKLNRLLAADVRRPDELAEGREQQLILAEVLQRLPEDYRQVIVLRNLNDLSHAEVAARMQRSEGAVRMLWMRALARLKRELGPSGS